MIKKAFLMLTVAALLLVPFSVAAPLSITDYQLGNYSFTYNSSTGTMNNLTYHFESGNQAKVADSVIISGNSPLGQIIPIKNQDRILNLNNATLYSSLDEDMLLSVTISYSSNSSIVYNLANPAVQINLDKYKIGFSKMFGSMQSSFTWNNSIYKITAPDYIGFLFSNSNSVLSNDNKTITFEGQKSIPLMVGIATHENLMLKLEKYMNFYKGLHFNYNESSGDVAGTFVSFNFNESTGILSNYSSVIADKTIFDSIYATGSGTFGGEDFNAIFPLLQPLVIGSVFMYANSTSILTLHNNPSLQSNFLLNNGTLVMDVSNALNITQISNMQVQGYYNYSYLYNYSYSDNRTIGIETEISAGSSALILYDNEFMGVLQIYGANVSVNGHVLSISTNGTAKITFVSPPGLQGINPAYQSAFRYAFTHGRLAVQMTLSYVNGTINNLSYNYNNSVQMRLSAALQGNVTFTVDSKFANGTVIAVFVPSYLIKANATLSVTMDGTQISLSDLNTVMNATSTSTAYFYSYGVSNGTMILLYIPHFSLHTISITEKIAPQGPITPLIELIIGVIIVAALALIVIYALRRRNR